MRDNCPGCGAPLDVFPRCLYCDRPNPYADLLPSPPQPPVENPKLTAEPSIVYQ